jgi:hypothetical protein
MHAFRQKPFLDMLGLSPLSSCPTKPRSRHPRLLAWRNYNSQSLGASSILLLKAAVTARYASEIPPCRHLLLCAIIVVAAAVGSVRYYSEVLNNEGWLRYFREPRFLNVCRELEKIKSRRVLVFETSPWLTRWLCYHARHNDVYFDRRFIIDPYLPPLAPFLKVPDLANVDFVATLHRIVDVRAPGVSCLSLVDDFAGEDRTNGHDCYWLGPPAVLRFLALRPILANLKMRLSPGPEATTFPIDFFLADEQGRVSQGEIRGEAVDVRQIDLPRGASYMQLSVKAKVSEPKMAQTFRSCEA